MKALAKTVSVIVILFAMYSGLIAVLVQTTRPDHTAIAKYENTGDSWYLTGVFPESAQSYVNYTTAVTKKSPTLKGYYEYILR